MNFKFIIKTSYFSEIIPSSLQSKMIFSMAKSVNFNQFVNSNKES